MILTTTVVTCWFHAWEPLRAGVDIFKQYVLEQANTQLKKELLSPRQTTDAREELREYKAEATLILPYEQIRLDKNKKTLPPQVDRKRLEKYLTDDEFASVFKMTREQWTKVPTWKQEDIKFKLHLW